MGYLTGLYFIQEEQHKRDCRRFGLDPKKTTDFELRCKERNLDPKKTTIHELDCLRYMLNPKTTSPEQLNDYVRRVYEKICGFY